MLKPLGTLEEKDCYQAYAEQVVALDAGGVDFLLIETQFDLVEASLAVEAARDLSTLPLVCSFSYDRGTRTMMGVRPSKMAQSISDLGVDMLGINCGRSLQDNLEALKELKEGTDLPIWFKPNAGLPTVDEKGQAVYDVTPDDMGALVVDWIAAGASVVGGCCGSTPEHIRQIAQAVKR